MAVVQINKNPRYTNARGAFKLLNDDLESYKNIADAVTTFPLTGTAPQQKTAANRRLAAILSKMIEDFALMSILSDEDNKTRQKAAMASYKQDFPNRSNVPLLMPSACHGPTLGPLENEHALESHNRCWMLTKYFKYCQQLSSKAFENRFPADGDIKGTTVPSDMIPAWMKPKPKPADPESAKAEAIFHADGLSNKTFTLRYNPRYDNPDSRDAVEEHFKLAAADGIEQLSTVPQDFLIDPRLYDELQCLRDQIRRQLRCHIFRFDLARVTLKYKRKEEDGTWDQSVDLMNNDWNTIKPILHDEANDDFNFHVGFTTRPYEGTEYIFEIFNAPPHLVAYS